MFYCSPKKSPQKSHRTHRPVDMHTLTNAKHTAQRRFSPTTALNLLSSDPAKRKKSYAQLRQARLPTGSSMLFHLHRPFFVPAPLHYLRQIIWLHFKLSQPWTIVNQLWRLYRLFTTKNIYRCSSIKFTTSESMPSVTTCPASGNTICLI